MSHKKMSVVAVACCAVLSIASQGFAVISSADFREDLDLPDIGSVGPRVLESLGQPLGAGDELTEADEIANPTFWREALNIDLDAVTNILTLTPTDFNTGLRKLSGLNWGFS